MDCIRVIHIKNILDPNSERIIEDFPLGTQLREMIPMDHPLEYDLVISKDGHVLASYDPDVIITVPCSFVTALAPQGGGGGGKALQVVAMIAIAYATWGIGTGVMAAMSTEVVGAEMFALGGGTMGFGAAFAGAAGAASGLGMSYGMLGLMGVAALASGMSYQAGIDFQPPQASTPTYSWENTPNQDKEGIAFPVLYGTMRIKPPLLNRYIAVNGASQWYNLLYCISDHAVDTIDQTTLLINNNPVDLTDTTQLQYFPRKGDVDGNYPDGFGDSHSLASQNVKVGADWETIDIPGNTTKGINITFSAPRGLFHAKDDGTLEGTSVDMDVEYKLVGASTWTPLYTYSQASQIAQFGQWWQGWYKGVDSTGQPVWGYMRTAGTTDPNDHTEYERISGSDITDTWETIGDPLIIFSSGMVWRWHWVPSQETYTSGTLELEHARISGNKASSWSVSFPTGELPVEGEYQVRFRWHDGTPPEQTTRYANEIWCSYTDSIVYDDFIFPGVALMGIQALATNKYSGGMPQVSIVCSRNTVQVWDTTLQTPAYVSKPASNPAWICYDMLHNSDYGAGIEKEKLIYSEFKEWADFCDLVETGKIAYTCNLYVDTISNMRRALDLVSLLGRGRVMQKGNKYGVMFDAPHAIPVQGFVFNQTNMLQDSFSEDWIPYSDRANMFEITYWDSAADYQAQKVTLYSDDFETTASEVKAKTIQLVGCTSRAMAVAYGYYLQKTNRYLTYRPSWTSDIDALGCVPGDIVEISHDGPQYGFSGRVIDGTLNTVTLDRAVTMLPGTKYYIIIRHILDDTREERELAAVVEEIDTFKVTLKTGIFTDTPVLHDLYVFGEENHLTKLVRIISITKSQSMRRQVKAIEYLDEVYDDSITTIGEIENQSLLAGTSGLRCDETFVASPTGMGYAQVNLYWHGTALKWDVYMCLHDSNAWEWIATVRSPQYTITDLTPGIEYDFSVSDNGTPGQYVATHIFSGYPDVPSTQADFFATLADTTIVLSWDTRTDVSIKGHNIYLNSVLLVSGIKGNTYTYAETLTAGVYAFTLRDIDAFNQESGDSNTATITITVPATPSVRKSTNGTVCTLSWQQCKTSLAIAHYTVNGTHVLSPLYSETVSWAEKEFTVIAVDVAGNVSASAVVTVTVPVSGTVTAITTVGKVYAIQLMLTYLTFPAFEAVEIWASETNDRATSTKVAETTGAITLHSGIGLADTWYYWTRVRNTLKEYGAWYPLSDTAGQSGSPSSDPSDYLEILNIDETGLTETLRRRISWLDQQEFIFDSGGIFEGDVFSGVAGAYNAVGTFLNEHDIQLQVLDAVVEDGTTRLAAAKIAIEAIVDPDGAIWTGITDRLEIETYDTDQNDLDGNLRIAGLENRLAVYDTNNAPQWVAGSYVSGQIVKNGGLYWRCLRNTATQPTVSNTYWDKIDAGLISQWMLKLNANGHVASVGLSLDGISGASEFDILANKFRVVHPSDTGSPIQVFIAGVIGNVPTVGINGNLIVDETILARSLVAHSITTNEIAFAPGDVTLTALEGGLAISGGGITLAGGGAIKGGKSTFSDTDPGFFLGYESDEYVFNIGDTTGYMTWDGDTLDVSRSSIGKPVCVAYGNAPESNANPIWINTGVNDVQWNTASNNAYSALVALYSATEYLQGYIYGAYAVTTTVFQMIGVQDSPSSWVWNGYTWHLGDIGIKILLEGGWGNGYVDRGFSWALMRDGRDE